MPEKRGKIPVKKCSECTYEAGEEKVSVAAGECIRGFANKPPIMV